MPLQKTDRQTILADCWRTFHARGYRAASIQELARSAGLGKAGLLHHFGSKEELMRAVLDFATTYYTERILAPLNDPSTGAPRARFRTFMERHLKLSRISGAGCFFANTTLETGVEGTFGPELLNYHKLWTAATLRFIAENLPHVTRPEELCELLFTGYQGSVLLYKLHRDEAYLERMVERNLNFLFPSHDA